MPKPPEQITSPLARLVAEAVVLAGGEHQCAVLGHNWVMRGGKNAGCTEDLRDCGCSVPVNECDACGDCDYGDNDEADAVRARCREKHDVQ